MQHATTRPRRWTYAWWLVVGLLLGGGVAGLLSIGVFFLLAALVLTGIGLGVAALRNRSAMAVPAGVGLSVLWLAWLSREGPGTVCHFSGNATTCTERVEPVAVRRGDPGV